MYIPTPNYKFYPTNTNTCPQCGYCPTCGRSNTKVTYGGPMSMGTTVINAKGHKHED